MNTQTVALRRRKFICASGTLILVGAIGNQRAHSTALAEGTSTPIKPPATGNPCVRHLEGPNAQSYAVLTAAAQRCVTTANGCVDYFVDNLGLGGVDSGDCLAAECLAEECLTLAQEVVATCTAMTWLASRASGRLAEFGPPTVVVCGACAALCAKLKKDHAPCVHCEAACRDFIRDWSRATESVDYYF